MKEPVLPLSAFNSASRLTDSDNVNYQTCPVCHSNRWKVYVNTKRGVWMCFAGEHSAGGRLAEGGGANDEYLREALAGLQTETPVEKVFHPVVDLPETKSLSPCVKNRVQSNWNLIDPEQFRIRQWPSKEGEDKTTVMRILIPYFDREQRIIGYTGRRIFDAADQKFPKYMNLTGKRVLYNPSYALVKGMRQNLYYDDTVFIVEGAFDSMRLAEHGYNALAIGGKKVPAEMLHDLLTELQKYDIIVVLLDLDACNEALDLYLLLTNKLPADKKVILGELPGKDVCALSLDQMIDGLDDILAKGLNEGSICTWNARI